jgi:hypothetical protein
MISLPYGMFSDSTSQLIASTTTAQVVTFNTDEHKYLITHSTSTNPSRIIIDIAGTYLITVSGIIHETTSDKTFYELWLAVDGTNVARSNTRVECATKEEEMTLGVSFIYTFTAGQYFELKAVGSSTTIGLQATGVGSTPTRPASPSIILTVNRVA